jgi:hypothetical protein
MPEQSVSEHKCGGQAPLPKHAIYRGIMMEPTNSRTETREGKKKPRTNIEGGLPHSEEDPNRGNASVQNKKPDGTGKKVPSDSVR